MFQLVSVGDDHSYRLWHVKSRDYTEEPDEAEGIEGDVEIVDTSFDQRLSEYRQLATPPSVKISERESDNDVLDLINKLKYPKPKFQSLDAVFGEEVEDDGNDEGWDDYNSDDDIDTDDDDTDDEDIFNN
jgi:hypothetical protein